MSNGEKNAIRLKPGRERSLYNRHPWIFSGAVEEFPDLPNGSSTVIIDSQGTEIGTGYFNRNCSLAVRVLSFDPLPAAKALEKQLLNAFALRARFRNANTTALRLVNGEADGIPGCIIDQYDDVVVIQCGTLGMELLKGVLVDLLVRELRPRAVYEKSTLPSRSEEGLKPVEGPLYGALPEVIQFQENGLRFETSIPGSQKTGFFLDQREMRSLVRQYAGDRTILNCFSYSGAFSVYGYAGGARQVRSIDSSAGAISLAARNLTLNGFPAPPESLDVADVFDILRGLEPGYDFIILDPPAFAKRRSAVEQALKGYNEINRVAMQKLPPGGLLLTCSCSHHVSEEQFQKALFQAARDAHRSVRVLQRHRLAWDHPGSLFFPEGEYLKSLLMIIE